MTLRHFTRRTLPVAVSVGTLTALAIWIRPREILTATTPRALGVLTPSILLYALVALAIEARCIVRLCPRELAPLSLWTAARIKAASYLVQLLHYALGVGALTYLLQRRTGVSIVRAAGIVLLISFLDFAVLLAMAASGVVLNRSAAPEVGAGLLGALAAAIVGGVVLLRAPGSLGSLDRLRESAAFAALRAAPAHVIGEVCLLRVIFVSAFISLIAAALRGFDVVVPLPDLVVSVVLLSVVAALPIAAAGLGTGQAAFLYIFRGRAAPQTLLACSLALSAGLLVVRAMIGLLFAHEFGREALAYAERSTVPENDSGFER